MKPAIKKILVPTDFSDLSMDAVRYAQSLAELYGAQMILFHVIDDVPVMAFHTMDMTTDVVVPDSTVDAEQRLEQFAKTHDVRGHYELSLAVSRGNPHEEVCRFAQAEGVDLIVMATHGRTGLAHVLMGSVAEKVVQRAHIPVLTVKPSSMRRPHPEMREHDESVHA